MGEAKNRKNTDKNYGHISNKKEERGLVISSPMAISGSRMTLGGSDIDPTELRFALLFWDKLAWPQSQAIRMGESADISYLSKCGILSRPSFHVSGDVSQGIAKGYINTFVDLEKKEPGKWSMSQGERGMLLEQDVLESESGIALELFRAIPIPSQDVALADILEFKLRRRDELRAFQHHVDQLTLKIKNADTPQETLTKTLKEIDLACSDLLKVSKEYQLPFHLSDFKTAFNIDPMKILNSSKKAWDWAEPYGLAAATASAFVAGAFSTVSFKPDFGFRPLKLPKSPYRYAYSIGQELI